MFAPAILPQPTGEAVKHRPGSRTQCDGIRKPTVHRDLWVGPVSAFLTSRTWIRVVQVRDG